MDSTSSGGGDVIGRDKQIHGDEVHGDKYELSGDFRNATITITTGDGRRIVIPLQRPPRATHFTGREQELSDLLAELQPGRIVTLVGPGGIGKTALAAEAIHHLAPDNDQSPAQFPGGIILRSFYGQPSVLLAADHIARSCGVEEIGPDPLAAAQRALGGRTALLILDGAEEADDLNALLRIRGNSGVLITSRSRKDVRDAVIELSRLPLDDAVALLQAWGKQWAEDKEAVEDICELVGTLALAVRLAGAYLSESSQYAAEYLEWLRASGLAALDFGERRTESIPVLLSKSLAQVSEQARTALAIFGCLALARVDVAPIAAALDLDEHQTRRALGELIAYGLLLRPSQTYELAHPLLHTYARERLAVSSQQLERSGEYYDELARRENDRGLEGYRVLDRVRPYIMTLFDRLQMIRQWEIINRLAWTMQGFLHIQGHWLEEIKVLKVGLAAARGLGRRYDERAHLNHLGLAYAAQGKYKRAIDFYQQALVISREISDRRGEGNALGNMGVVYHNLGQDEQAVELYQRALVISREISDRRGEGNSLAALGLIYAGLGQVERAIDFYQQALVISREIGDQQAESKDLSTALR
jgi:tetratricopeptide (TPR) repeat protein